MATLENATHPKALANRAKHLAFNRCGELNLNGMVDTQIAVLEKGAVGGRHGSELIMLALHEESVLQDSHTAPVENDSSREALS